MVPWRRGDASLRALRFQSEAGSPLSSDRPCCREIWTITMVTASFISGLSHAVDLIEKQSQQNRPWKVVTVRLPGRGSS
jgi:hypothetical protein